MTEGNESWGYFEREHQTDAAFGAIEWYAKAYDLHPRNREAVAGLKKAADTLLDMPNLDATKRQELASFLQTQSAFYKKYAPVVEAARQ
jgi:hypothetical protein